MNCSDACSGAWRIRLLEALAGECARLGVQIARLDDAVTAGDAGIATLRGLAAQSRAVQGLGGVLDLLCGSRREVCDRVARLPLPAMRRRLRAALADDRDDTVTWLEA